MSKPRDHVAPATALSRRSLLLAGSAMLAAGAAGLRPAHAQGTPKQGGTLIYLEQQAHTNLYPPAGGFYPNGGILNQITDKLTYQNPKTLEIEPWLAESWQANADLTEFTFKLRPGVTFSDGTPLDAKVVARNYDVYGLGDKEKRYPVSEVINNYAGSEVIDPLTVRFKFKKSSPGFLQGTSVIGSGIVSLATLERSFDELGDATKIIGSGPFVVTSETIGKELTLAVRKDYNWAPKNSAHQGRAYLDAIKYIITPEDSVRIGALLSGQADFIRQVQAYDESQVTAQRGQIYASSTRGVNNGLYLRPENPLLADLKVRQALLHATNAEEVVNTIFSENYPQATGVVAKTALGYIDLSAKLKFDQALAKKLLDEAGWRPGRGGQREKNGTPLVLSAYESLPQPQSRAVLQLIAQQWAQIGVKLNVMNADSGAVAVNLLDPSKTPVANSMVGRADLDVIKSQFFPANRNILLQKGGIADKVKDFSDDKLNADLDALASEIDPAKRTAIAQRVQSYIIDQAYMIPIFEEPQVFAGNPYVKGIGFEAVGRPSFYDTWLDKR
ncbi:TIGR04028 family ABC transporter substrate-binding protein [Acetobacteraceae bacterium H6797]|nr:TIGR04028 family ABC transporter substrate-binding protein [Acetobacteraceae bacterium H6797]